MGQTPPTNQTDNNKNIDTSELDTLENMEDVEPTSINTDEMYPSLDELFGDGSENVKIEIYRVSPKVFNGKDCGGYVGLLEQGDDMELLRQKFGGGKYRLQQKIGNRFADQLLIVIAGNPRTELTPFSVRGENEQQPPTRSAVVKSDLDFKGIPIGGSMEEFESSLQRIAMIKAVMPTDINTALLGLVMDRQQTATENPTGSMVDQLKSFVEVIALMKADAPAASGKGSTIYDLGSEALQAFTKFLEVSGSGKAKMQVGQPVRQPTSTKAEIVPTVQIQQNGAKAEVETVAYTGEIPENTAKSEEMAAMNVNQIAEKAGSYIASGFIQEPPQTPEETAEVLKIALPPLPDHVIAQLNMFKDPIFNMSKSILTNQVETSPEEIEKFRLFYDEVFSIFTKADDNLNQKGEES